MHWTCHQKLFRRNVDLVRKYPWIGVPLLAVAIVTALAAIALVIVTPLATLWWLALGIVDSPSSGFFIGAIAVVGAIVFSGGVISALVRGVARTVR